MGKILLTSTGFDNINIKNKFLSFLDKNIEDVKILFIITAANDPDSVRILSGCLDDLTSCNIKDENIIVYDMHKSVSNEEIINYDAIYVCGGSTKHLVERINEIGFQAVLDYYLSNDGIYIGVSAGSVAASGKYKNGLGLISNVIDVHCENGTENGIISNEANINLTDNQAICIEDDKRYIFE